jgi:hypothetical protein
MSEPLYEAANRATVAALFLVDEAQGRVTKIHERLREPVAADHERLSSWPEEHPRRKFVEGRQAGLAAMSRWIQDEGLLAPPG